MDTRVRGVDAAGDDRIAEAFDSTKEQQAKLESDVSACVRANKGNH